MTEPQIYIHPMGRMANRMFQFMLASEIRRRAGVGRIVGHVLTRWGLVSPPADTIEKPYVVLRSHNFDLDHVAYLLRSGAARTVIIAGWGMRLAYYGPPARYRGLFRASEEGHRSGDDELLIHIRADDILNLHHPHYCPMPFSFYEQVIAATDLRPVFMGQIGTDAYSQALRRRFAGATFLEQQSPIADFTTIRTARNIVLSVSSFAWLAAWLSETARRIHLPILGLFDPRNGRTFLLPLDDGRYRYHLIDGPAPDERPGFDLVAWAEHSPTGGALAPDELHALVVAPLADDTVQVVTTPAGSPVAVEDTEAT
jgi:hypothetical protein